MSDSENMDSDAVVDIPTKKRKRDVPAEDELEIDINLPEPPSKKALRKAKKAKTSKPEGTDGELKQATTTSKSEEKSAVAAHSVWIGNMPFIITKAMLKKHLTESSAAIPEDSITRINLPAPRDAKASKTTLKPQNKGFAYVDFSTQAAFEAALALSETHLGGRALLIKDAKSFVGRPTKEDKEQDAGTEGPTAKKQMPTRRVFVGNLGFDVTKEELQEHYATCGEVENVHVATFEDTGKCKGFAWITFAAEGLKTDQTVASGETAASDAVRGWTQVKNKPVIKGEEEASADEVEDTKPKKDKPRKWFLSRLRGRALRCEFAEDPETRYKKRFGKDKEAAPAAAEGAAGKSSRKQVHEFLGDVEEPSAAPFRERVKTRIAGIDPGAPTDFNKRRGRTSNPEVTYRTGAMVEGKGKKVTFD